MNLFLSLLFFYWQQGELVWDDEDEDEVSSEGFPPSSSQPQPRYRSSDEEDDQDEFDVGSLKEVSTGYCLIHCYQG